MSFLNKITFQLAILLANNSLGKGISKYVLLSQDIRLFTGVGTGGWGTRTPHFLLKRRPGPIIFALSGAQKVILLFLLVKFNFCRKKSATKFLCVKTSCGKIVATLFPYLTVHSKIAGDVPSYLVCAQIDPAFK